MRRSRKHQHRQGQGHFISRTGGGRYHPDRDTFELFVQGGGNPWTLSFDRRGRAFSGDNGGNSRGFPLGAWRSIRKELAGNTARSPGHTSYGYISNMDHQGYAARFAMTSVVYEDGKIPGYEGQLISAMAPTSRIQASRLVADSSTLRTVDTETLVTTADRSFPVRSIRSSDLTAPFTSPTGATSAWITRILATRGTNRAAGSGVWRSRSSRSPLRPCRTKQ